MSQHYIKIAVSRVHHLIEFNEIEANRYNVISIRVRNRKSSFSHQGPLLKVNVDFTMPG